MCLTITIQYAFNTAEAFERAIAKVTRDYPTKHIHGVAFVPGQKELRWENLQDALKIAKESDEAEGRIYVEVQ